MEFIEVLNLILDSCPFLRNNDYDGIIVKKLAATNTISDTGASHQSHMAFTGRQKDFFPFLNADGYFNVGYESKDDDLKKYFTLQIPVTIYKENTDALSNGFVGSFNYSSDKKTVKASVLRSRRNNGDDQIELSIKSLDDEEFIEFRKLLRVNDFFVLLKHRNELKYDLVGIRSSDKNAGLLSKCTDFYKLGTQTPVSIEKFEDAIQSTVIIPYSHNRIVFGAPGTGKSHKLNDESSPFGKNIERVTFHPNYSYAQFVGTYKPITINKANTKNITKEQEKILNVLQDKTKTGQEKYDLLYEQFKQDNLTRLPLLLGIFTDDEFKTRKIDGSPAANDNGVERNHGRAIRPFLFLSENNSTNEIKYEYVPGPFMRIYVSAKKNPSQIFLLIIEEINRANVAAVFGDVFQLLDRKSDGASEYPIAVSEDIKKYLAKNGIQEDSLSIPSNMYIWATMNSADQGVFPMDTAFKRRWEFEYIGIDENEKEVENFYIPISESKKVKWNELRKAINDKLIELGINEDKLLGPFFLNNTMLENAMNKDSNFIKSFESKVLMYLFEDAAKMKVRQLFNLPNDKYIYSEICKKFENDGLSVFNFTDNSKVSIEDIETELPSDNGELFKLI
ncbi:MAG: AAA family ATPase [Spirochaetales bacterium]|nr:AAA family ATPase [Spirochaetales bacterium]